MDFRDLAVAVRVLRKSPVFALTAALTIALGVGAGIAIFSVQASDPSCQFVRNFYGNAHSRTLMRCLDNLQYKL